MFPPQAPWTGLGQLESEINSVKSDLRGKANDYEVRQVVRNVDMLQHSVGNLDSASSRLEYELQALRQDLEELKQRVPEIASSADNNAQPENFALRLLNWMDAKLRAVFCSVKKLWSVAKVR